MSSADDSWWLVDLRGRIVLTHQLDPVLPERELSLTRTEADAVIASRGCCRGISSEIRDRLPLIANILVRIGYRSSASERRANGSQGW